MRLLVESEADPASLNLGEQLRDLVDWSKQGLFNGDRILAYEDLRLITLDELHLHEENLHQRLPPSLTDPDVVIFLSRHASESGTPTMSVHPIGNFADAPYGGRPDTLVATHPAWMAGLFCALERANPDGFDVTYEATHHGPYLDAPTLFYELGSTEDEWTDPEPARLLVEALLAASPVHQQPVLWVGGSHYCPQLNDAVRAGKIAPGHIIPGWAAEAGIDDATLDQAIATIPGCAGFVLQPDPSSAEAKIAQRLETRGIDQVPL